MSVESGAGTGPPPPHDGAAQVEDVHAAQVWVQRVGSRTYEGHNSRGAVVRIGPAELEDVFTPGELLKIALAGCVGMSADHTLARRLGPQVAVTVRVGGDKDPQRQRYPTLFEELLVDLSQLDDAERDRVIAIVHRAVDRTCTVGRTLEQGATLELVLLDAS